MNKLKITMMAVTLILYCLLSGCIFGGGDNDDEKTKNNDIKFKVSVSSIKVAGENVVFESTASEDLLFSKWCFYIILRVNEIL